MLLDGVARGLAKLPETKLEKHPRMADFAKWVTACETAFWPAGAFLKAYTGNRDVAVETTIDSDPIAAAMRSLMATQTKWAGTASESSGRTREGGGRANHKIKELAADASSAVRSLAPGGDVPPQDRHRIQLRPGGQGPQAKSSTFPKRPPIGQKPRTPRLPMTSGRTVSGRRRRTARQKRMRRPSAKVP